MSSNQSKLSVRVLPSSAQNKIIGFSKNILQVKIAAPPVEGKANRELVAFLSRLLGVSKSQLTILRGMTSRNKVIAIDGLSQEEVLSHLKPFASSSEM